MANRKEHHDRDRGTGRTERMLSEAFAAEGEVVVIVQDHRFARLCLEKLRDWADQKSLPYKIQGNKIVTHRLRLEILPVWRQRALLGRDAKVFVDHAVRDPVYYA